MGDDQAVIGESTGVVGQSELAVAPLEPRHRLVVGMRQLFRAGTESLQTVGDSVCCPVNLSLLPKAPAAIQLCLGRKLTVGVGDDLIELSFGSLQQARRV